MPEKKIRYCRECRKSHHLSISTVKRSFLENEKNVPSSISRIDMAVLEDYTFKNIIKRPQSFATIGRLTSEISKEWKSGRVLTVSFMGGSPIVKERLIRHAKTWMEFAGIEFDFKPKKKPGDVRISFDGSDGSWSYIGTEILSIPQNRPTMNFGWLTPTLDDEEYHRVVLHEFGHTLACIHEHSVPDNGIPWDKPKVYAYYKKHDGWSKEEVDEQVFLKYDRSLIRGTKVDKKSIMMYDVPNELTIGNFEILPNMGLSANDKKFIAKLYPKK